MTTNVKRLLHVLCSCHVSLGLALQSDLTSLLSSAATVLVYMEKLSWFLILPSTNLQILGPCCLSEAVTSGTGGPRPSVLL